jgi:glucose/arabinose dehydrogenase
LIKILRSNRRKSGEEVKLKPSFDIRLLQGSALLLWLTISLNASDVLAQVSINWPEIELIKHVSGIDQPVHINHAGEGSGRLFVVEQPGRIRVIKNGFLLGTPFLDITDRAKCCDEEGVNEQGLLSVAFPPDYENKGYFYVNYTRNPDGNTVVARYFVTGNPDVADPRSEEIVLMVEQPFANHNGGQLAFGPDGYLYIGMGDGGGGGDPQDNAQSPGSLLGKMLRIDVESGNNPYAIPQSNPFTQATGFRDEIWALGFRNPWRFSFDQETGDLYIADVGQNSFEEVDFQPAYSMGGENYGWNVMEGAHCFKSNICNQSGLVLPVVEYDHSQGCSITGGFVYRGDAFPRMQGVYFYGDFCSGNLRGLKREGNSWQNTLLLSTGFNITTFGEDEEGNLYLADYPNGDVYLITDASPSSTPEPTPTSTITTPPTNVPGGSSCAIGSPVNADMAAANVLIPLIPVFVVSLRTLKRKTN